MTRDDIIRMARQTDLVPSWMQEIPEHQLKWIEDFAKLVYEKAWADTALAATHTITDAAVLQEREACAKVAFNAKTYIEAAAAIRARGQAGRQAAINLRVALGQPNECRWLQDGDGDSSTYMASCNRRYFMFEDGTPKDNRMSYCCYCSKPLVEVLIDPEDYHD